MFKKKKEFKATLGYIGRLCQRQTERGLIIMNTYINHPIDSA